MSARWLLLAVGLAAAGCSKREVRSAQDGSGSSAVIFVSADMRGYIGPCGCSENMRGGIARAAHQLAEARKAGHPVLYVDAGDSLFGRTSIPPEAVPQEERKAKALAEAFKKMGLATRAVGELDDARGAEFRSRLELPDQPSGVKTFELLGRMVAVIVARDEAELQTAAKSARAQGAAFVLALYHQPLPAAQKAAALPGLPVDLIVTGHGEELSAEDNKLVRGAVPVVQLQSKGRSLLRIDLFATGARAEQFALLRGQADVERELSSLDQRIELLRKQVNEPMLREDVKALRKAKLEEIIARREALAARPPPSPEGRNAYSLRFVPLESNFPSLPEVQEVVTRYDRDVGQLNLAWAREHGRDCPPPSAGQAGFVGNEACRECHAEAFPVWEESKHAHAYATLEQVGKNFHLDCVKCHVTGYERPGGVCRIDKVEGRKDVGCESCHGPGSLHVEDPSADNVVTTNEPKDCIGCHDPENSPHFEFKAYLAKILGPGHGQPLPKDAGAAKASAGPGAERR